jgi:hypothetical protein
MKSSDLTNYLKSILQAFSEEKTGQEEVTSKLISELNTKSHEIEQLFQDQANKSKEKLSLKETISIKSENWVRAVLFDYSLSPLSFKGSLFSDSRFSKRGQQTIYLGQTSDVASREVQFPEYFNATTIFGINVNLQIILDLSSTEKLNKDFKIDKKLFQGNWKKFSNLDIKYYTQFLSDILRLLPIEGFLYESIQLSGQKCLCVFPDKLIKGSSLEVIGTYRDIEEQNMKLLGTI